MTSFLYWGMVLQNGFSKCSYQVPCTMAFFFFSEVYGSCIKLYPLLWKIFWGQTELTKTLHFENKVPIMVFFFFLFFLQCGVTTLVIVTCSYSGIAWTCLSGQNIMASYKHARFQDKKLVKNMGGAWVLYSSSISMGGVSAAVWLIHSY